MKSFSGHTHDCPVGIVFAEAVLAEATASLDVDVALTRRRVPASASPASVLNVVSTDLATIQFSDDYSHLRAPSTHARVA